MIFGSWEVIFSDFMMIFLVFENDWKYDSAVCKYWFGITGESSGMILVHPGASWWVGVVWVNVGKKSRSGRDPWKKLSDGDWINSVGMLTH